MSERGLGPVMDALTSDAPEYGLRRAWLMARATFAYTWRCPGPDDVPIGFWYALSSAANIFLGYLCKPA